MDARSLIILVVWLSAFGLMMWRWPNGDRFHVPACIIGGGIWLLLAVVAPVLRTPVYAVACVVPWSLTLFRRRTEANMARVQQTPRNGD